jgi:two-component system, NtrC family, response regulator GlrR
MIPPPDEPGSRETEAHTPAPATFVWEHVDRFRLTVVEGPGAGRVLELAVTRCALGSHELNDVVLDDATVSRFHCEIRVEPAGPLVVDLHSKNGTVANGMKIREGFLTNGALLQLGRAQVRFELLGQRGRVAVPQIGRFGSLIGAAPAMRTTLAQLARAAASDVTVLLEGETGTGKGKAAEALHQEGARRYKPFVVVDCGAIPENLLESELFGHEKGAFTGAHQRRIGAFEEASGGTLFLDEIGEMPTSLQPKLLRALENREIRRVGSNRFIPVDIRVVAATNRDLRAEVNAGRFRPDLYFRLAVARVPIPPLRERPQDLPALVEELLNQMRTPADARARLLTPAFLESLERGGWPGNVRELRNHVERCLVFEEAAHADAADGTMQDVAAPSMSSGEVVPYVEARRLAANAWERSYLEDLLARFGGKVAPAAEAAGIARVYLYRLIRRQGLKPGE